MIRNAGPHRAQPRHFYPLPPTGRYAQPFNQKREWGKIVVYRDVPGASEPILANPILRQDKLLKQLLVKHGANGQGNFGSVDGDSPAAMRQPSIIRMINGWSYGYQFRDLRSITENPGIMPNIVALETAIGLTTYLSFLN